MSGGPAEPAEAPAAPRMLTSVPWIVVLLGVGLIVGLLVIALLSLRGEERQPVPAPAPPMYLPTLGPDAPTSAPPTGGATDATGSATPSPSATASPSAGASRSATPRPSASTRAAAQGAVTARYEATASDRSGFEARLTVVNGSAGGQGWEVELFFTGNVKTIEASSASGVSVSTQGSGVFVLRGIGPLPAGQSATVRMRFGRTGTGDQPGRCTVNGADCVIG
ncbi:cellulose binding domain-containing protein [Micromonospora sp. MA102]|uniref:cellulose binding domain-containing protein n=1 Tax=Micromonospora sp. MA102 TaxID=2952755 RepID=UPI0021CA93D9|nr:cellulose binding domain-containing protein [Micromonospora sp. MA102]